MIKLLAEYIMRGRLQAMLVASTLATLSLIFAPLSIFSSGTVALVTLRRGAYEGLIILISASLAAVLLATLIQVDYQYILLYVVVLWIPVWVISLVLREGRHISLAVEVSVLIGIVVVVGYYLFFDDPAAMWKQVMPRMIPQGAPTDKVQEMISLTAPYMTGIAVAGGVFSMLLGLFMGRWWQAMLYNPGGFRLEFLGLSAQSRVAMITLAILAVAMISAGKISQISWNTVILLFVLYALIGVAVIHSLLTNIKIGHLALPMFYITLMLIRIMIVPVALVGFSDTWFNFRHKFLNKT